MSKEFQAINDFVNFVSRYYPFEMEEFYTEESVEDVFSSDVSYFIDYLTNIASTEDDEEILIECNRILAELRSL